MNKLKKLEQEIKELEWRIQLFERTSYSEEMQGHIFLWFQRYFSQYLKKILKQLNNDCKLSFKFDFDEEFINLLNSVADKTNNRNPVADKSEDKKKQLSNFNNLIEEFNSRVENIKNNFRSEPLDFCDIFDLGSLHYCVNKIGNFIKEQNE